VIQLNRYYSMAIWAARDIQRQAGRHLLLFACLFSLVVLAATALFFSQALDATWARLVEQAPDLVIRRIDAGGWAPLPADEAIAHARRVPGVLDPTPRLWGVAVGPGGPVTVVASTDVVPERITKEITPPSIGQAVVGQKVAREMQGDVLDLMGVNPIRLTVVGTFPAHTGLATHDVVWLVPADARQLLDLAPRQASDLAVHLFRREEEQAIQTDLAAAFPWPVSITDRSASALRHHTVAARTGGIAVVAGIPALLALLLIIASVAVNSSGQRTHWGLLQAMGWTTGDLVRLQIAKALIVGTPALLCGLVSAYTAVFYPPAAGITALWVTGGQRLPMLPLNRSGVIVTMLEVAAMVGLPYLAAVFLACLRSVAGAPWTRLQADPWN
jgi:hypothetical protein